MRYKITSGRHQYFIVDENDQIVKVHYDKEKAKAQLERLNTNKEQI